jgi:hypothetical protein
MALELVATKYAHVFNLRDFVHLQMTDKSMYITCFPRVQKLYESYLKSDKYRRSVIRELNAVGYMINQFQWNSKILENKMYDYLIMCYENWAWITLDNYKHELCLPTSAHFTRFMREHGIHIQDLLPAVEFHYTHHHRPTKSFTYYKTIKPHALRS